METKYRKKVKPWVCKTPDEFLIESELETSQKKNNEKISIVIYTENYKVEIEIE
jgi:hypothetical protein